MNERKVGFRNEMERVEYAERKKQVSSELRKWSGQGKKKEDRSRNLRVKPGSHTRVEGEKLQVGPFRI